MIPIPLLETFSPRRDSNGSLLIRSCKEKSAHENRWSFRGKGGTLKSMVKASHLIIMSVKQIYPAEKRFHLSRASALITLAFWQRVQARFLWMTLEISMEVLIPQLWTKKSTKGISRTHPVYIKCNSHQYIKRHSIKTQWQLYLRSKIWGRLIWGCQAKRLKAGKKYCKGSET